MKQIGVLAVLFVVLLAAVISKESSRPSAGSLREQVPLQRLGPAAFEPDTVARIEIAGPGGADPFALVRDDARWLVVGAFRAPASAGAVEELIQAVAASRGELRLDDTAALVKFDLTPERAPVVTLRDAAGKVLADFTVGRSSGTQGAFVRPRFEGVRDGAYAVSQDLRGALGLPRTRPGATEPAAPTAAHFHDKNLPSLALEDTARIEIDTPNWSVAFEKAGVEWAAVEGAPDLPLRPSSIRRLVSTLGGSLTATALADPARRAELGLDAPSYRVTAVLADGSRRSAVGAADAENKRYFVRLDVEQDPDVVYECARHVWESLFPTGSQLFEFRSLGVENKGLGQVRIDRETDPFVMTRPDLDTTIPWEIATPAWPLPSDDARLRDYVTLLNSVRPSDWYAGEEPFQEEAVVRYGSREAPVEELAQLRIGQPDGSGTGRLAILANAPDRIVVLPDATVDRLLPELLTMFGERPLDGVLPADVTSLLVTERDAGKQDVGMVLLQLSRGDDGAWTVGDGRPGNANGIASWIDDLIGIEIVDRTDEPVDAAQEITIRWGDETLTIGLGPEVDGERRITLDGMPFVTDTRIEIPDDATLIADRDDGPNPGAGGGPDGDEGDDADDADDDE